MPDSSTLTSGASGLVATANLGTVLNGVAEPMFMWCSLADELMYFPSGFSATNYTGFHNYISQFNAWNADADGAAGLDAMILNFRARSMTHFKGRAVYGNTIETGVAFTQRVRWSVIGNPLVIEPGIENAADSGGVPIVGSVINGTGAGFADLNDYFAEEIVRVEAMGDLWAVYLADGIAFIRPTGLVDAPFAIEVQANRRGLLGTHALSNLDENIHFGVFTDGWYLLNENGVFVEVGRIGGKSDFGTEGEEVFKWKSTFYQQLDVTLQSTIYTSYEPERKLVRIKWVDTAGVNRVWVYDVLSDRVFDDVYDCTCFGTYNEQVGSGRAWESFGAPPLVAFETWLSQTGNTWASYRALFGNRRPVHGTTDGLVFAHNRGLSQRDGIDINWQMVSLPITLDGNAPAVKLLDKLWIETDGTNRGRTMDTLNYAMQSWLNGNAVTQLGSVSIIGGTLSGSTHVDLRSPGSHFVVAITGFGDPRIRSMRLEYHDEQGTAQGVEGGAPPVPSTTL